MLGRTSDSRFSKKLSGGITRDRRLCKGCFTHLRTDLDVTGRFPHLKTNTAVTAPQGLTRHLQDKELLHCRSTHAVNITDLSVQRDGVGWRGNRVWGEWRWGVDTQYKGLQRTSAEINLTPLTPLQLSDTKPRLIIGWRCKFFPLLTMLLCKPVLALHRLGYEHDVAKKLCLTGVIPTGWDTHGENLGEHFLIHNLALPKLQTLGPSSNHQEDSGIQRCAH